MLSGFLGWLSAAITGVISAAGYGGLIGLMALESACVPLPSEIIMPFAGYLASTGRFNLFWVATAGAIGCNVGSTVAYFAASYGGRRLIERWGAFLLISHEDVAWSERFFSRFGGLTVLIGRMLPVVRTFIAVPAGLAGMSQLRFQLYTFFGSWIWCFVLAYVGFKLGQQWDSDPRLRNLFHQFDVVVVALMAIAIGWFVWRRLRAR